jgi:hypothetical protein
MRGEHAVSQYIKILRFEQPNGTQITNLQNMPNDFWMIGKNDKHSEGVTVSGELAATMMTIPPLETQQGTTWRMHFNVNTPGEYLANVDANEIEDGDSQAITVVAQAPFKKQASQSSAETKFGSGGLQIEFPERWPHPDSLVTCCFDAHGTVGGQGFKRVVYGKSITFGDHPPIVTYAKDPCPVNQGDKDWQLTFGQVPGGKARLVIRAFLGTKTVTRSIYVEVL